MGGGDKGRKEEGKEVRGKERKKVWRRGGLARERKKEKRREVKGGGRNEGDEG